MPTIQGFYLYIFFVYGATILDVVSCQGVYQTYHEGSMLSQNFIHAELTPNICTRHTPRGVYYFIFK